MYIYFKSKVKVTRKNGGKIKNKNKNKNKNKKQNKKKKKNSTSELIPKQKRQNVLTLHSPLCICIKIRFEMVHYSLKIKKKTVKLEFVHFKRATYTQTIWVSLSNRQGVFLVLLDLSDSITPV